MPVPSAASAPSASGTPAQQTAYYAQQADRLRAQGRYDEQQRTQNEALGMAQAEHNARLDTIKALTAKMNDTSIMRDPRSNAAAMQALAALMGRNSGVGGIVQGGGAGMVDLTKAGIASADSQRANQTAERGQDLSYAGHKLAAENDMSKANLHATVQREGMRSAESIHAADADARASIARENNDAHIRGVQISSDATRDAAASRGIMSPDGSSIVYGDNTVYTPERIDKATGKRIPASRRKIQPELAP